MKNILLILTILLMFNACTNKNSAFKYFNKSKLEVQAIQNSKKIDILEESEPKTLIWVTYLNKIEGYEDTSEKFLISLYFPNAKNQNLLSLDYDIFLNDNKFTNIKKIDKDDEKYSKILNTNSWGNSYLVEFQTMKDNIYKLNLKLSINSSLAQLEFEK